MKNISLVLNAILFVLVGILFYFQFKDKNKNSVTQQVIKADGKSIKVPQIAYIDIDSLQTNYAFFKKGIKDLEVAQAAAETELNKKATAFQTEYQKFIERVQSQNITQEEGAAMEEKLAYKKQEIDMRSQQLEEQFAQKTQKFDEEFKQKVVDYLIKYNADGRYSYILPYVRSAINIMYVDKANNITDEVIKGMNEEYSSSKK